MNSASVVGRLDLATDAFEMTRTVAARVRAASVMASGARRDVGAGRADLAHDDRAGSGG